MRSMILRVLPLAQVGPRRCGAVPRGAALETRERAVRRNTLLGCYFALLFAFCWFCFLQAGVMLLAAAFFCAAILAVRRPFVAVMTLIVLLCHFSGGGRERKRLVWLFFRVCGGWCRIWNRKGSIDALLPPWRPPPPFLFPLLSSASEVYSLARIKAVHTGVYDHIRFVFPDVKCSYQIPGTV